jgi:hypothetical protein
LVSYTIKLAVLTYLFSYGLLNFTFYNLVIEQAGVAIILWTCVLQLAGSNPDRVTGMLAEVLMTFPSTSRQIS